MGKKGPICQVCGSAQKHLIELGLVHRIPVRVLARRFEVSKDSVFRHRRLHMPPQLVAAIAAAVHPTEVDLEQLQRSESESLLGSLVSQRARLLLLSELAFQEGALSAAASIERAVTNSLELTSRVLGMIVQHHTHTSVLVSSDYLELRGALMTALRPFPEAAQAVAAALHALETKAATDIKAGKPLLLEAAPA
jgi:hypothetical protein